MWLCNCSSQLCRFILISFCLDLKVKSLLPLIDDNMKTLKHDDMININIIISFVFYLTR